MSSAIKDAGRVVSRSMIGGLMPPADRSGCDWAEENIVIPIETGTPWPGHFSADRTPWVRGWYDVVADIHTRLFAVQKGAQVANSQTWMNIMFDWVCNDPGAILYMMDSMDNVRATSKLRLQPIINASPTIKAEIRGKENGGDGGLENVLFQFNKCFVRMIGASSAGQAASFTHSRIILEEPEKYKDTVGREGNVIENIMQRVKRIWNSKVLIGCTPSTPDGFIAKYEAMGDRMRYFCPCPHCEGDVVLKWGVVVYDAELSPIEAGRTAYIKCPHCAKKITDAQKVRMVDFGVWRPTAEPKMKGWRSAWIGGLYPKDESASIRAFVEKYLSVKDNPSDLQVHINSDRGEVYTPPPVDAIGMKQVWEIQKKNVYERGLVPGPSDVFLVATVDKQAQHLVYSVWAMDLHNQWLVDNGFLSVYEDIDLIKNREYYSEDGTVLGVEVVFLDTSYDTMNAYKFVLTRPWVLALKGDTGASTTQSDPVKWNNLNSFPGGKMFGGNRSLTLYHPHPGFFKDQFANAVNGKGDVCIWFHSGIDSDYVTQLGGEVVLEDKANKWGAKRLYWKKVGTNDQFDCAQYGFMARHIYHARLMKIEVGRKQENESDSEKDKRKQQEDKQREESSKRRAASSGGLKVGRGDVRL